VHGAGDAPTEVSAVDLGRPTARPTGTTARLVADDRVPSREDRREMSTEFEVTYVDGSRGQRHDLGVGGSPAVPARSVLAAGVPFQPTGERRQVLYPRRGLVHPGGCSPREVEGQSTGVGAGCANRPAFAVEEEAEVLARPGVFDVGVVHHRPALPRRRSVTQFAAPRIPRYEHTYGV
jgi:hypothetical protein